MILVNTDYIIRKNLETLGIVRGTGNAKANLDKATD